MSCILFLQGEADAFEGHTEQWSTHVKKTIEGYRKALKERNLKFLIGEIVRAFKAADKVNFAKINAQIPSLIRPIPQTYLVSSDGLTDRGDDLHYDSKSAIILGQRNVEAVRAQQ